MAAEADEKYMKLALDLARKGRGKTSPNPMVGAVIVKGGKIVGRGYHKKAGTDHAEIVALKKAGSDARGASLYVTLEPCCHYGRTQPCTREIIRSGVREVIFAVKDPNPMVDGKGARQLKEAGIAVRSGMMEDTAREVNEVYFKYMSTGRPFVILKLAQSLDGRIATRKGDSRWVTGTASRKLAHRLRAEADAVVVGAGTVRTDNPRLTARLRGARNPYRIVLTASMKLRRDLHLIGENDDYRTILATNPARARLSVAEGLIVWGIRKKGKHLSLTDFLEKAGKFGITSILVEGGRELATSFIRENLVDRYYFFLAPMLIGKGVDSVGDLHVNKLTEAIRMKRSRVELIGDDILVGCYPERAKCLRE